MPSFVPRPSLSHLKKGFFPSCFLGTRGKAWGEAAFAKPQFILKPLFHYPIKVAEQYISYKLWFRAPLLQRCRQVNFKIPHNRTCTAVPLFSPDTTAITVTTATSSATAAPITKCEQIKTNKGDKPRWFIYWQMSQYCLGLVKETMEWRLWWGESGDLMYMVCTCMCAIDFICTVHRLPAGVVKRLLWSHIRWWSLALSLDTRQGKAEKRQGTVTL